MVWRIAASRSGRPPRMLAAEFGESGGCGGGASLGSGVEGDNAGELVEKSMETSDMAGQ